MHREKIIDRIRKLLALSKSSNEHEAAAAAERACALMLEFQISQASLDAQPSEPIGEHIIESAQRIVSWKGSIANGVAHSYGCRMFWRGAEIIIVGRDGDVAAVRYTYQYLVREVTRLTERAWKQTSTFESARRWKHAFRIGAAQTIRHRLAHSRRDRIAEQQRQASRPEVAQALQRVSRADEELAAYYERLSGKFRAVRASASSHWGYSAGRQAGQTVSLGGGASLGAPAPQLTGKTE